MVFSGLSNGALMSKLGYYMPWYLAGGILTSVGGGLMSTFHSKLKDMLNELINNVNEQVLSMRRAPYPAFTATLLLLASVQECLSRQDSR